MASSKISRPTKLSYFDVSATTSNMVATITDFPSDLKSVISAVTTQGSGNTCRQIRNTSSAISLYTSDETTSTWRIFYETY